MKLKSFILAAVVATGLSSVASATSVSVVAFGSATNGGNPAESRAVFINTSTDISAALVSNLNPLLAGPTTSAEFDAAVLTAIGADPGGIFHTATSDGAGAFSVFDGGIDAGAPSGVGTSFSYILVVAETGANVDAFSAHQGAAISTVDGSFAFFSPGDVSDIGIGTVGGGGYGLAPVVAVPEPSIALLGALGVLGLIRRRR